MLRMLFKYSWGFLYLLAYSLVYGLTSASVYLFNMLVRFVSRFPRVFITMVCIGFVFEYLILMVGYKSDTIKQNIRFDSLAVLKDSIESHSTFDSGYAKGLVDGNNLLNQSDFDNGHTEKKSIIRSSRRARRDSIGKE